MRSGLDSPATGRTDNVGTVVALGAAFVVLGTVVVAVRLSLLAFVPPVAAAALAVGVLVRRRSQQREGERSPRTPTAMTLVAFAWVGLAFIFAQKFTHQALSGASVSRGSAPSVENLLQIGSHLL